MKFMIRSSLSVLAGAATYYFVYWLPFSLILPSGGLWGIRTLGSMGCAVAATYYLWRYTASLSQGFASAVMVGALLTGSVGFAVGFFGPIIFMPEANQGPLLGLFITGPLGILLGAIGGGIYWGLRRIWEAKQRTGGSGVDLSSGVAES